MSDDDASQSDDPRVFAAVQDYLAQLEAGRRPNRRDFLARHTEIATELGACLDGLAFVHSAAGKMTATPKAPEIDAATAQPLGDFRLVREIGRGGMGTVYEAIQLSLGRRVALKVLPMAAALDSRHLERFRNEASAAAQLHHTNIVPVYAVGCERSVHFYAMQLIEGQSLDDVIRDVRDLATPTDPTAILFTSGGLTSLRASRRGTAYARSVASLGMQVAEALDYAHRAGIVHRDIKPANLLLDAKGTVWITDFGLALFYADNNLTRSGDLVGTLRYMSPEQASGRAVVLDQRTDIYSLATTLYELLTLERAHTGTTHEQLLYQLSYVDPRPPRSIDRTIPREMEVILGKAMAKDPADRYQSAQAMADDLRRFLRDEPILARPPSALDKTWKWTRRHKAWALAAVAVITLAAIGLLVSTLLIARAQANTRRNYALAQKSFEDAREAVDFFSGVAIGMDHPQFSEVRRDMLEESLEYYQQFIDRRRGDPSVSAELAAAQARVSTYLQLYAALDAFVRAESRLDLLANASVRADLKLSPEADTAATKLASNVFDPRSNPPLAYGSNATPEDRRQKFTDRARDIDLAITQALGPQAAERLQRISRQIRGPAAFSDPDVVERLALTHDQRAKIRDLRVAYRNTHRFAPPGPPGPNHDSSTATETLNKITALLTPSQSLTWSTLTGPPTTAHILFHGPDTDGGPGPHGPRSHDDHNSGPPDHRGPPPDEQ